MDSLTKKKNPEELVLTITGAVNAKWPEAVVAFMCDDVRFRFANHRPVTGAFRVEKALRAAYDRLQDISITVEGTCYGKWKQGAMITLEASAACVLQNGLKITVPCAIVLRMAKEQIADCRVFLDPTPLPG